MRKEFSITSSKNVTLYGYISEPSCEVKGIVQICHGMAEHIERYFDFMDFLSDNGYIVVGYNQRGHGKTAGSVENQGYMDDKDNFDILVQDVHFINNYIKKLFPNKIHYLFGHSMGSFVSQRYTELYGDEIDGLILCGSSYNKGLTINLGYIVASMITKFKGRSYKSKFVDNVAFGSYNKKFKPNKTTVDWLSRDNESNLNYLADEYCGAIFSVSYFKDLSHGFKTITKNLKLIRKDLPILIISGDADPVGNYGKGTTKLYKNLKKQGVNDLTFKLYKDARHELLNEINKEEVVNDILEWINNH